MATAIRHDKQIAGIMVYTEEQKVSLYADDTTLYLSANEKNLIAALETLKQFQGISGLKVNIDKTKIIKIGVWGDSRDKYCLDRNLIWTNKFVSLGITFDVDNMQQITEINMEQKNHRNTQVNTSVVTTIPYSNWENNNHKRSINI